MKKQSGFTLIELVIVVVILGLLAVTAIPKFLDLTSQAQQANIEGMAGGYATGVSLIRAQWEAEGRPSNASNQNSVSYDGTEMFLTFEGTGIRPGYVTGLSDNGNDLAGLGADDCVDIWENILQQPPKVTDTLATLNGDDTIDYLVSKSGTGADSLCHYYLEQTLAHDGDGNATDPGNATNVGNSFTYQPANSSVIVYINAN
ncbi:type II secretion system protein [Thalassomonas haliotis]|uniref:Type II secretion system protein n=1 Tax=Thalassomonas haliotis TaxID=485448 RepID=A0ABY7VBQ4_9GAMM|nr:type II secretion system protein [Thalassomonas haliotis]WDE10951.1 type II secretion system protein [Thalassomonas haliotis]